MYDKRLIQRFCIPKIINKHAPLKQAFCRQKRLTSKPWISRGILISIRKNASMFKSHFLLGNSVEKSYFCKYSNKLAKIMSLAKKLHLPTVLKNQKRSQKEMRNTSIPPSY